jgi:acyl-CoA synthetase (AMP-forming)/AMP-acid ligase II
VVGENMDSADFDTRRLILAALHVRVYVYRTDEKPRARLTLALPLSGVREIPLPLDVQSDKSVTAPYKYPREIEFVTELPKTISGKIGRVELRERERRAKLGDG